MIIIIMKQIGLLSDTHSHLDSELLKFFTPCDEIWHAGDIGDFQVIEKLEQIKPLRAVYGNIDNHLLRANLKKHERFLCEEVDVWITHIGGYPGRYDANVKPEIYSKPPKLFICGHSHILKVVNDPKLKLLHINPGAAGKNGFHEIRTAVRFKIDARRIFDLEILEIPRN